MKNGPVISCIVTDVSHVQSFVGYAVQRCKADGYSLLWRTVLLDPVEKTVSIFTLSLSLTLSLTLTL